MTFKVVIVLWIVLMGVILYAALKTSSDADDMNERYWESIDKEESEE